MGAKGQNFHNDAAARLGYEAEAATIQELYLAGDKKAAIAAVPTSMIEQVALIGPVDKIKEELTEWRKSPVTTLLVQGPPELLRQAAELIL